MYVSGSVVLAEWVILARGSVCVWFGVLTLGSLSLLLFESERVHSAFVPLRSDLTLRFQPTLRLLSRIGLITSPSSTSLNPLKVTQCALIRGTGGGFTLLWCENIQLLFVWFLPNRRITASSLSFVYLSLLLPHFLARPHFNVLSYKTCFSTSDDAPLSLTHGYMRKGFLSTLKLSLVSELDFWLLADWSCLEGVEEPWRSSKVILLYY